MSDATLFEMEPIMNAPMEVRLPETNTLPATRAEATGIMEVISRAAQDPTVDVDKLERLMGLYERVGLREAEQAFNDAMSDAQKEMGPIAANAENPQTRSKYATYAALDKVLRPIYTKHGFALSFDTGDAPGDLMVRVLCYVSHRSGFKRPYHIDMPADGKGAKGGDVMTKTHATGSAMSYGQRYLLKMVFNIAVSTDDDGNAASGPAPKVTEAQAADIRKMIEATSADIERFCKYMKVEAVVDLPAKDYQRALDALNKKGGKK